MIQEIILANAKLVLPERIFNGSLGIKGEMITAMDQGAIVPKGAIDCDDDNVAPGLAKLYSVHLERHIQLRPKCMGHPKS